MKESDKIRDAATIIVVRDPEQNPAILMGQRGAKAAFMPNKFVFPGGAVDAGDDAVPLHSKLSEACQAKIGDDLRPNTSTTIADALSVAAIRELWEETGLLLGAKQTWTLKPTPDWAGFADTGHMPSAQHLSFVFRAITPPGRPRRFDARFFLLDAKHLIGDLDDFSRASDELSHLQWVPLSDARNFDLPFITEVVLAEIGARLPDMTAPSSVPFFKNTDEETLFKQLYGHGPTASDLGG